MSAQAVGAYGEKVVEAQLLRLGWIPSNVNASVKNAVDYDILAHRPGKPVIRLRVKTSGPGVEGFQFTTPRGDVEKLDFTILVRMGKDRAGDQFYVLPTSVLRNEISGRERDYLSKRKRDGTARKNTGHWSLRMHPRKDGRSESGYDLAERWSQYLNNWPLLEKAARRINSD